MLFAQAAAEATAAAEREARLQREIEQLKAQIEAPRPVEKLKPLPSSTVGQYVDQSKMGDIDALLGGGKRRSKSRNKPKKSAKRSKRAKTAKRTKSRRTCRQRK